jgi:hypothetical protein
LAERRSRRCCRRGVTGLPTTFAPVMFHKALIAGLHTTRWTHPWRVWAFCAALLPIPRWNGAFSQWSVDAGEMESTRDRPGDSVAKFGNTTYQFIECPPSIYKTTNPKMSSAYMA